MVSGVVIADAGPLIGLARIGHLDLQRQLFGAVIITPVVAAESGSDHRGLASRVAHHPGSGIGARL